MIVVDASVVANAIGDDGADGDIARARLRADPALHAPYLIDLEVASVLRRSAATGRLSARRALTAIHDFADLPVIRYPHVPFLDRIWELRSNLTPYDASYVALAETLGCPFVTGDARIARVRVDCEIEVLP